MLHFTVEGDKILIYVRESKRFEKLRELMACEAVDRKMSSREFEGHLYSGYVFYDWSHILRVMTIAIKERRVPGDVHFRPTVADPIPLINLPKRIPQNRRF